MSDILRIAALALDIKFADVDENIVRVERLMEEIPISPDVVVLPELFTTSFVSDADLLARVAEPSDGPVMLAVKRLSHKYDAAICGSFIAIDDGHIFNRAFFVEPSGKTTFYDKRHLFCLSPEAKIFSAGQSPLPVVDFRGWKIAMMVCYDLRFPVWSRNRGLAYDLLLVPANWPHAREYAWTHLLIARAIENQAIVVGCNRSGSDDYGSYDGLTYIYDAFGRPIGRELAGTSIVIAEPSLESVAKLRRRLPVCSSADRFDIVF